MKRLFVVMVLLVFQAVIFWPVSPVWAQAQQKETLEFAWPPVVDEPYPDLKLMDHKGQWVQLSSFKGKVILVEPIGMNCPACNAFAGAHKEGIGGFLGIKPQPNLDSIDQLLPKFSKGVRASDKRLVMVHLLLYNMQMKAPTLEEAKAWAKHFRIDKRPNYHVLLGDQRFLGPASYNMIPGFQLIDRDFVLRSDSTGHHPKHNLYQHLLPMVRKVIAQKPRSKNLLTKGKKKEKKPPRFASQAAVKKAYQKIPHRQTVFDPKQAKMDEQEKAYLLKVFHTIDQGIFLRTKTLDQFYRKNRAPKTLFRGMDQLIGYLQALEPPKDLTEYRDTLVLAIQDQKAFFVEWQKQGKKFQHARQVGSHPKVRSSSQQLKTAYDILMRLYGEPEEQQNKDAFFDYHCALDFI